MSRTTKTIAAIALLGTFGFGLTACSTESASAGKTTTDKNITADAPAETTTPSPAADEVDTNAKFGETVSYEGLDVSVGVPQPFTPSQYAATGQQPNNVTVEVTIKNTGTENFDPSLIYITASSAGSEATSIFDSENGINGSPSTTVPAGQTVTWKEAFNVANPDNIIMDVSPGAFEYESATFTN